MSIIVTSGASLNHKHERPRGATSKRARMSARAREFVSLARHCERQSYVTHGRSLLLSDAYGAFAIALRRTAVAESLRRRKTF